jgi:hypothetical protein
VRPQGLGESAAAMSDRALSLFFNRQRETLLIIVCRCRNRGMGTKLRKAEKELLARRSG